MAIAMTEIEAALRTQLEQLCDSARMVSMLLTDARITKGGLCSDAMVKDAQNQLNSAMDKTRQLLYPVPVSEPGHDVLPSEPIPEHTDESRDKCPRCIADSKVHNHRYSCPVPGCRYGYNSGHDHD